MSVDPASGPVPGPESGSNDSRARGQRWLQAQTSENSQEA